MNALFWVLPVGCEQKQLLLCVPGTKLKVNTLFIVVSFIVIVSFRLKTRVFVHDAFYLYVFVN